jgi:ABC-2 type transport system permease protein
MNKTGSKLSEFIRITLAIGSKDIIDAMRNKTSLSIMLGVAFLVLTSQALPIMLGLRDMPKAYYVDQGKSLLMKELIRRDDFIIRPWLSQEELVGEIGASPEITLGLLVPADFDALAEDGAVIELEGTYPYWAPWSKVNERVAFFEEQLGQKTGTAVRINVDGHSAYPPLDSMGFPIMVSLSMTMVLITISSTLVPLFILDEKEKHTFEALLVSPAKTAHIVMGKAIAGLFYCLLAGLAVYLFNLKWWVHSEIALLVVLVGSLSAISIGLLLGTFFEDPTTINMWVGFVIIIQMVPVFLESIFRAKGSILLNTLLNWLPAVAISRLVRVSLVEHLDSALILSNLGVLSLWAVLVYGLVVRQVSRMDR